MARVRHIPYTEELLVNFLQKACNGCGKLIKPDENAVKLLCPSCGDVQIWRCEKCRNFALAYKCIKCGFTGP